MSTATGDYIRATSLAALKWTTTMAMTLIQLIATFRKYGSAASDEKEDVTVCSRCHFRVVGRVNECCTCGLEFRRHGRCSDSLVEEETDIRTGYRR